MSSACVLLTACRIEMCRDDGQGSILTRASAVPDHRNMVHSHPSPESLCLFLNFLLAPSYSVPAPQSKPQQAMTSSMLSSGNTQIYGHFLQQQSGCRNSNVHAKIMRKNLTSWICGKGMSCALPVHPPPSTLQALHMGPRGKWKGEVVEVYGLEIFKVDWILFSHLLDPGPLGSLQPSI